MTDKRKLYSDDVVHQAFEIVQCAQWFKHKPRHQEIKTICKCLWIIIQRIVYLRRTI